MYAGYEIGDTMKSSDKYFAIVCKRNKFEKGLSDLLLIYDRSKVASGTDIYARKNVMASIFLLNPSKETDIETTNIF